jgi:hypothetical protein
MTQPERSGKASDEQSFFLHSPKARGARSKQLSYLIAFEGGRALRSRTNGFFAPRVETLKSRRGGSAADRDDYRDSN